jgi:DNA invertase Pin-like site-specific DNA recombinase
MISVKILLLLTRLAVLVVGAMAGALWMAAAGTAKVARQGVYYGYARVSTKIQATEGKSLDDQVEQIKKHYAYFGATHNLLWGDVYVDGGVSAFKRTFKEREAGKVLYDRLMPGDHIVMISLDRGFRRFEDAVHTIEGWVRRGVHVHLLNYNLSTDNHIGRMLLRILAVFAEFQREVNAERNVAIAARVKAEGGVRNQYAGYGQKLVGPKDRRRAAPDNHERAIARAIVRLHDERKRSFKQIWLRFLEKRVTTREGTEWSLDRIKRVYNAAKKNPKEFEKSAPAPAAGPSPPASSA